MTINQQDTVVAIATAPGLGGVGVVRVSGPDAANVAKVLIGRCPKPRYASHASAVDSGGHLLDQGIALYFPNPNSFTGEDVFEFQGHGSPVVLRLLVDRCLQLGCRMARPGEFSERAFLNGKLDLAQAEAIADLIESSTESAARAALRSLRGDFSKKVHALVDELISIRVFVEASIDFPEEEIDFLAESDVDQRVRRLLANFAILGKTVKRGTLLRDAVSVVLIGPPNAGKSSLLNALSQDDRAIVSDIPGTTRDTLEHAIQLDGLPVNLIDTAGLREGADVIEQEGIRRARKAVVSADLALLCVDGQSDYRADLQTLIANDLPKGMPYLVVDNKADLSGKSVGFDGERTVVISAKSGAGIESLCQWVAESVGYQNLAEGQILARQRHMDALNRAEGHVGQGLAVFEALQAGELLAEELMLAQQALGEITGEVSSDDLLGEIFGSFCIGK